MSSNGRVHTDSRQKADLLYRRPANQNESHSSMTITKFMLLLVFLELKK